MDKQNKISWVALRGMVARRAGVNEKKAKLFMDALVEQLAQALANHESVRINGLGTFRVLETAARKSVDVRSGEAITIPSYHKLSFVSDASLKKDIGFDNPAVPADSDPMRRLSEQADELVGILADMGQNTGKEEPMAEEQQPVVEEPLPVIEEQSAVEELLPVVENPLPVEEEQQSVVEEQPIVVKSVTEEQQPVVEEEPVIAEQPVIEDTPPSASYQPTPSYPSYSPSSSYLDSYKPGQDTPPEKNERKKPKGWMIAGITLAVLCVLLVAAYFVLQYKYSDILDNWLKNTEVAEVLDQGEETENDTIETENDTADWEEMKLAGESEEEPTPMAQAQTQDIEKSTPKESVLTSPRSYKELITTDEMRPGGRLTLMAQKYYGHKDLWVFIYEANLGRIKSPTNIEVGTPIRIPKLSEQLMDVENPETKELMRQLREQYSNR